MNITITNTAEKTKSKPTFDSLVAIFNRLVVTDDFFVAENDEIYFWSNSNNYYHGFLLGLVCVLCKKHERSYVAIGRYGDYSGYISIHDSDLEFFYDFFSNINSLNDLEINFN